MGKIIQIRQFQGDIIETGPILTPSQARKIALYEGMVSDFCTTMRARRCGDDAVNKVNANIEEFHKFSNKFPWEWTREDFEQFSSYIFKDKGNAVGTQRIKQKDIKRFTEYLIDGKYFHVVRQEFDTILKPICLPDNMIVHKVEYDNQTKKRVFSSLELQNFFDRMDDYIRVCYETRNKALNSAMRDKALFYVMVSYGVRINEIRMIDITDLYPNPEVPEFGKFGYVHIRFGKASHGSNYKERRVYTLDIQVKDMLEWYINEVRTLFINKETDDIKALFYSERGDRISIRSIQRNFKMYLHEFGMYKDGLTPHSMRHTFSTINQENPAISSHLVQKQLGHEYLSTTQHYTHLNDTYISKNIRAVAEHNLKKRLDAFREKKGYGDHDGEE